MVFSVSSGPFFKNFNSPMSNRMNDLIYSISISFSSTSSFLAGVGNISFVATSSLLSILLRIEVSISSSAATFQNGNPSCSRLFRKYIYFVVKTWINYSKLLIVFINGVHAMIIIQVPFLQELDYVWGKNQICLNIRRLSFSTDC